jgi:acyl-CoA dehydrogenase
MTTIGAGTTEVQKNIIAYRFLGLPRDADARPGPQAKRDRPLDETRAQLRDSVRRYLAGRAPIRYVRKMIDDKKGTTDDVWSGLAALGATRILVPEAFGGLGLSFEDMGVVLEELGRAVHPGPFLSSSVGAVLLLLAAGDEGTKKEYLGGLAGGTRIGTVALFEPEGGYEWRSMAAEAEKVGSSFRVTTTKIAPDAMAANLFLVAATCEGELGVFAVEAEDAEVTPLFTVDGTRKLGEVILRRAPARRIGKGDATASLAGTVDRIVLALVADAIGAADRSLEIAAEYAKVRRQFDRPIGSFQAVQHKLADMLQSVELARSGAYEALRLADHQDQRAFHRAAIMSKAYASDALYRVGADAIQVFGGIGFTFEHDAHLYYKRVMSMRHAFGGTPEFQEEYARLVLG